MKENLLSIFIGTTLLPIIFRVLQSKDFRNEMVRAMLMVLNSFMGRFNTAHYLFKNVKYYKAMSNDIKFDDYKLKKELFVALLNVKINSVVSLSKNWLIENSKKIRKYNKLELRGEIKVLLQDIVSDYEKKIKHAFFEITENKKIADNLFDLIYNGNKDVRGFKEYHNNNINSINTYIENIPLYTTIKNQQIVYHVLGLFDTALLTAIQDLKTVHNLINGGIKIEIEKLNKELTT